MPPPWPPPTPFGTHWCVYLPTSQDPIQLKKQCSKCVGGRTGQYLPGPTVDAHPPPAAPLPAAPPAAPSLSTSDPSLSTLYPLLSTASFLPPPFYPLRLPPLPSTLYPLHASTPSFLPSTLSLHLRPLPAARPALPLEGALLQSGGQPATCASNPRTANPKH